jgi:hypothetical protein
MAMVGLLLIGILLYCFLGLPATKVRFTILLLSTLLVIPLVSMLRFYARTRDHIIASEEGLTYHPHTGNPFSILWSQIAGLRPRALRNRYDVVGHQGQRLLTISYELEKVEDLDAIIRKNIQEATPDKHLTYHVKRPGGTLLLWITLLFLAQIPFTELTPRSTFLLLLLPLGAAWALFFEIRRITLDSQGLTIEYLLRRARLSFNDVHGVKLEEGWLPQHTIRIERNGLKPFKFSWPGDEASMILKTIEDKWRAFSQEKRTSA